MNNSQLQWGSTVFEECINFTLLKFKTRISFCCKLYQYKYQSYSFFSPLNYGTLRALRLDFCVTFNWKFVHRIFFISRY